MPARFFVYILSSRSRVLYTGVTRDLLRGFTSTASAKSKVSPGDITLTGWSFFEETASARSAFERERQIKGWSREKKIRLVESVNAAWLDLARDWFEEA